MIFRSENLPNHSPVLGGSSGPALTMEGHMNIKEIKKGDKILHSHMGTQPPVSGIVKESPIVGRGIRSTLLVDVKGSEVGLFDEIGSIYTKEVLKVFRDDNWLPVEHT